MQNNEKNIRFLNLCRSGNVDEIIEMQNKSQIDLGFLLTGLNAIIQREDLVEENRISLLEKMVKNIKRENIDKPDNCGVTPLGMSFKCKKQDAARILLQYGANPNIADNGNDCEPSIMELVCKNKNQEPVETVIGFLKTILRHTEHRLNFEPATSSDSSLLVSAIAYQDLELCELFIKKGFDVNLIYDNSQRGPETALDCANLILSKDHEISKLLTENNALRRDQIDRLKAESRGAPFGLDFPHSAQTRKKLATLEENEKESIFLSCVEKKDDGRSFLDKFRDVLLEITTETAFRDSFINIMSFLFQVTDDSSSNYKPRERKYNTGILSEELGHDITFYKNTENFHILVISTLTHDILEKIKTTIADTNPELAKFAEDLQKDFEKAVEEFTGKTIEQLPIPYGPEPPPNHVKKDGNTVIVPTTFISQLGRKAGGAARSD